MTTHDSPAPLDHETAVRDRYAGAAQAPEAALCCPTSYDPKWLALLPDEIIEKDYGCGDPSKFVREGETVVDLGSGAGKICYILSQVVGAAGQVIGVDVNDDMLGLARSYREEMAQKIGHANVRFAKAKIQDTALDLDALDAWLRARPVGDLEGLAALDRERDRIRREAPAVASDTVDVIVSNCVLNLVRPEDKAPLFTDMFRILKPGGRAVISDIVCDREPTEAMRNDPELWSGCISGAYREDRFLEAFAAAGFHGVEILERAAEPWQVVEGIDFRSVTVRAYKAAGIADEAPSHTVLYKGPFRSVEDDFGHIHRRGHRTEVPASVSDLLTRCGGAYRGFTAIDGSADDAPSADANDKGSCC